MPSFVVPVVVSLVSIPLFTKYLSPDEWGDYVLVLNSVELLAVIAAAWLGAAIVRFYAQSAEKGETTGFISTAVASGLFATLVTAGLVGVVAYLWKTPLRQVNLLDLVYLGLWGFLGRSLVEVLANLLRAQRKVNRYSALTVWQQLSRLAFGAFFVVGLDKGTQGLVAGWALGLMIGVAAFGADIFLHQVDFRQVSRPLARSMFLFGLPIVGGDIAFWLLRLSDRYMLRIFHDASEVGVYAVGVDLADRTLGMLVSFLAISSWPLIVQTWETKGVQPTSEFLTQLMRLYLMLCVPAAVGVALLSRTIMGFLADSAYHEGYKVIAFIAAGVFFFGFQRWFQVVLALYEKTLWIFISVLSGATVNILLNLLLIPSLGYQIAAVNSLVGYIAFTLMIIWSSRKLLKWRFPYIALFRVLLASCVMGIGVAMFRSLGKPDWVTLVVCASGGAVLYILALLVLKEVALADFLTLGRSVMRKGGSA